VWLDELYEGAARVCCPSREHSGDYAGACLGWPTIELTDDHGVDLTFNCDYHGDFVVSIAPIADTSGNVIVSVRWGDAKT
jgi:hypothetical protein